MNIEITYFEVFDSFTNLLDISGTFRPQNEGSFWWRVDGTLPRHQILEIKTTEIIENKNNNKKNRVINQMGILKIFLPYY